MADLRTISMALEAFASTQKSYAIGVVTESTTTDFAEMTPVPLDALERALVPHYLKKFPRHDGWGNEFEVRLSRQAYAIRTLGSDHRADANSYTTNEDPAFEADVVIVDGQFVQHPGGL